MKTILCPTDFSTYADKALLYAVEIAAKLGSRIILLHAYEVESTPRGTIRVAQPGIGSDSMQKLEALREKVLGMENGAGLEIEMIARQGGTVKEILDTIDEKSADLVVMGTRGATGLKEALVGSKAAAVIRKADIPVLAVPDIAVKTVLDRLAFATEFDDGDAPALTQLVDFARKFDAELKVVHVINDDQDISEEKIAQLNQQYLQQYNYSKISFHTVRDKNILDGLDDFMEANETDIVGMLTQDQNFLEKLFHRSLTERMAMESEFPILAFHE